jgi:dienelactone hydrolase
MTVPAIVLALAISLAVTLRAQTSVKTAVTGQPFVANFFLPACTSKCPVVLLIGGSGGGIWDRHGDALAQRGFAALALKYFTLEKQEAIEGIPVLPSELDQIPLEYFQKAINYVRAHPSVDGERIGIVGVSKGSELALLLAAHDARIKSVVAIAPSAVVWQSLPSAAAWDPPVALHLRRSSWTHKGQPLPFVPYATATLPREQQGSLAEMYRRSLDQEQLVSRAMIPVESINAPILLLSGKQDTTWPSSLMGDMVVKRLRDHKFKFSYEHIAYDDAGHMIAARGGRADIPATRRGGTEDGNRIAQDDVERRMFAFLTRHLSP